MKKLNMGEATKMLSNLIPLENIKIYFDYYQAIGNMRSEIEGYPNFPQNSGLKSVFNGLQELSDDGWIHPVHAERIMQLTIKECFKKGKGRRHKNWAMAAARDQLMSSTRAADDALNFLLCAVVYDLKHYKNQDPPWRLVVRFLAEQEAIDTKDPKKIPLRSFKNRYRNNIGTIAHKVVLYAGLLAMMKVNFESVDHFQEGFLLKVIEAAENT